MKHLLLIATLALQATCSFAAKDCGDKLGGTDDVRGDGTLTLSEKVQLAKHNWDWSNALAKEISDNLFQGLYGRRIRLKLNAAESLEIPVASLYVQTSSHHVADVETQQFVHMPIYELHFTAKDEHEAKIVYSEIVDRYNFWNQRPERRGEPDWMPDKPLSTEKQHPLARNFNNGKFLMTGIARKPLPFNTRIAFIDRRTLEGLNVSVDVLSALLFSGIELYPEALQSQN